MSRSGKRQRERARRQRRALRKAEMRAAGGQSLSSGLAAGASEPIRGSEGVAIDASLRWHLARTGPHLGRLGRKTLDESLQNLAVPAFQPRASLIVVRRGRRVVRHVPLLIRTLIIGVRDGAHLEEVQALPGISEIVSQPEPEAETIGNVPGMVMKPARLDPKSLQRFLDAVARNEIVQPVGIKIGDSVIVREGPFASFPGIVEEILPGDFVKVGVSIFGRSTPVRLGIADLQRI
ncbi:hypothetical protein MMB17_18450 [Methylobacterium organophilum]|uniref:transcription termination/antitermination protein NusG n=1 Tax=Methylobacterium organophilum TaxID=410 RepID=UPI001F13458E|nr:hypothetical protein [Methylobacterium organophilum]UMY16645.1 hypothetical protein MMB17_18450 [Methylobacterium organophilum]